MKFKLVIFALFILFSQVTYAGDITVEDGKAEIEKNNEVFLSLKNTEANGRDYRLVSAGSAGGIGVGKFSIYDTSAGLSRLTIDNGNVGIGTTAPGEKLTIWGAGTTNTEPFKIRDSAGTEKAVIALDGSGVPYISFNTNGVIRTTSGGASQLYLKSDGNVGIGTTGPDRRLHIEGPDNVRSSIHLRNTAPTPDNDWVIFPNFNDDSLRFTNDLTDATHDVTITGTGNVGIGTSPGYKLDVAGDIRAQNAWLRTTGATGWYSDSYGGGWHMQDGTWVRSYNDKNVYTGGEMQAGTVRGNSNLCIGGDCRSGWPAGGDGLGGGSIGTPNYLAKWTGSGTLGNSVIFDNGNVGIGTASPDPRTGLQIVGSWLKVSGSNHGDPASRIGVGSNWWMSENTNGYYAIHQNGIGDKLTIDTSGNVGIGTSPSGYKLDVAGDVRAQNAWLRTTGATGWYSDSYGGGWYMEDGTWIRAYNNKGVYTAGEMQAGTVRGNSNLCIGGDCRGSWPSGGSASGWTDDGTNVRLITSTDNVGIGTAPSYKLDVSAPANDWKARFAGSDGYILIGPANSGWAHIYTDRPNFIFDKPVYTIGNAFSSYNTGDLSLQTGGTTRIFMRNSDGNVGIGTTGPQRTLDVGGSGIRVAGTAGGGGTGSGMEIGNTAIYSYNRDTSQYNAMNIGDSMYIASGASTNRNVGIGTSPSGYKLDVVGDIRAQNAWLRTTGNTGWYSDSYGGGWHMQDGTWIRAYNDKWVYTGGEMQATRLRGNTEVCIGGDCRSGWPAGGAASGWNDDGTTVRLVTSTDNVGIGTASPQRKLDISTAGQITFGDNVVDDDTAGIYWHGGPAYGIYRTAGAWTANTYQQLRMQFDTGIQLGAGTGVGTGYDKSYVEVVNGKGLMVTSGNVGIGTTGPGYKLDVNGDIRAQNAWLRTTGNTGWYSDSYGGGWFMQDTSWIRAYNNKNVYTAGAMQAGNFYLDDGAQIEGLSGRNYFRDVEGAGNLRVGAAWGYPGIYAESGDVVVGSASGIIRLQSSGTGDVRAGLFRDGDSGYYVDPASTSRIDTIQANNYGSPYAGTNSGISGPRHYQWGYQEAGPWSWPYPDLILGYHTGVKMGANPSYGGIRFYNDHPSVSGTEIMSIGNGDGNVRVVNELQAATVRGNSNLCIGGDCRSSWPSTPGIPSGMIAMFAGGCPSGWTEFTSMRGRFPRGDDDGVYGASTGGSASHGHTYSTVIAHAHSVDPPSTGTSSDGSHAHGVSDPGHGHDVTYGGNAAQGCNPSSACSGAMVTVATASATTGISINSGGAHSHTTDIGAFTSGSTGSGSGSTSSDGNLPPYLDIVFCQKT